jgi:signal transduction histidine kinase
MLRAPAILIADCSVSDTELAELLLRRRFPYAAIRIANDALCLAEALTEQAPNIAIVAPKLTWAASDKLLALLRRHSPNIRIILFGHEADILDQGLSPGVAIDGIARKSSAGYLALADIVAQVLARDSGPAVATPATTSAHHSVALENLPLAAFLLADDGSLSESNEELSRRLDLDRKRLLGVPFEQLLADGESLARWHAFRARNDDGVTNVMLRGADERRLAATVRRVATAAVTERYLGCATAAPLLATNAAPNDAATPAAPGAIESVTQEMRDIALVFSHDLKEPVQQIARLAQRSEEGADASARARAIAQIQECAQRASGMLDSMLEYLAVSARDSSPVEVDLNLSFEQACDNLRMVIDESDAQISVDHLPAIFGDEYQMLHLLQNLLANAIKFRGREHPEIRLSVEPQGQDWLLTMRDNGIGIAQPFLHRVFEMGQRLHTRDEYPGTGIGLALCKRIVERHGGRIWVTSNEGAGCSFFVRLPQIPAQNTKPAGRAGPAGNPRVAYD